MPGIADLFIGSFNSGRALAKDRQAEANQSKLAGLFSQAYATGKPDLAGIAAVSPDAAVSAQGAFADMDEQQAKQFVQTAQVFTQAMTPEQRAQAWPGIRAEMSKRIPQAQYPEQWDESLLPQAQQLAGVIARQFGGGQSQTPASVQELEYLLANPEARELDMARRQAGWQPKVLQTDQGYAAFDPRTRGVQPLEYGGGGMFAGMPGQVTSGLRTPDHNAKVGGVPNSYHLTDQARDIAPPQSQQEAQAVQQWAAQNGMEIIDEGDHWHLEPRGGGQRVKPVQKSSETELERRVDMARQMGASDEEVRRMVVGGDSARDAQRISTGDMTKARQKITQLASARQQLQSVRESFAKLKDSYSAGPGGTLLPTPDGQAFDRAVRNLAPLITAVTRVPGVGAMSDFEAKLQEASLPSRGTYENVTEQQINDLERLLDTIESGYVDLMGGTQQPTDSGSNDIDSLLGKYGIR